MADGPRRRSNSKLLVLLDQAFVSATNFLTTIIVGNACGAEQLGVYAVGFSIVLLATAIESALVSTPFTVFSQKQEATSHPQKIAASLANLVVTSLVLLLIEGTGWLAARAFLTPEYDRIFLVVIIATPCFIARHFSRKILLASFQAPTLLAIDLLVSGSQLMLLWQWAVHDALTASVALWTVGGINLAGFLVFLVPRYRHLEFVRSTVRRRLLADWSFGKWLVGDQALTIVSVYGSSWLLVLLIDSDAAGVFAACSSIVGLANPFLIGLGNYLLPRFSAEFANEGDLRKTYWFYISLTLAVMLVFTLGCILAASQLLRLFYPDDSYAGYETVLAILAVRPLFGSLVFTSHYALLAMHKPHIGLYASLTCVVTLVVLSLFLIPAYGIIGGAVAWTSASIVEALMMLVFFHLVMRRLHSEIR